MMRAIRNLPEERRAQACVKCRFEFRNSSMTREQALAKTRTSLDYVAMLSPKRGKGAAGRYVVRDGEVVREAAAARTSGGAGVRVETGITSEHLERHQRLIRRQHFMDRN